MGKLNFKTNINCGNCIKSVTPFLNQNIDIEHWEVDTNHPDKILTIEGDIVAEEIEEILKKAGFVGEVLKEN